MFFTVSFGGRSCDFDEVLAVSGTGVFTFDYAYPYLYVVDETPLGVGKILIYHVGDPTTPVLVSTTDVPSGSGPREPRIYGNHLYVPYAVSRTLAVWDVTNRASPSLLGSIECTDFSPGHMYGVAKIGDTACVGCSSFTATTTLQQIDVSDPSSMSVIASLRPYNAAIQSTMARAGVTTVRGAFLACGVVTGGSSVPWIATIDPSDFTVRSIVTPGASGGSASQIVLDEVDGDYAYMQNGTIGELYTFDVSDLDAISHVDALSTSSGSGGQHHVCAVADIDRLYLAVTHGSDILILDISDRANPVSTGSGVGTGGNPSNDMRVIDGCAGFVWGQGTGSAIHLVGEAPLG